MWRSISRFVTVYAIIRWIKPRWERLFFAAISFAMISYSHSEYMAYVEASGDAEYLVMSYQVKFTLNLLTLVLLIVSLRANYSKKEKIQEVPKTNHKPVENKQNQAEPKVHDDEVDSNFDDGFDFLREKTVLHGRSDKILGKK